MSRPIIIADLRIQPSPRTQDLTRISVEANYGGIINRKERLWYEIPNSLCSSWNQRGDSWLVSLLPLAVTLGRPLQLIDLPIDSTLVENLQKLMQIWSDWYPETSPIEIGADEAPLESFDQERKIAAFFSGGIDSFFTLLHTEKTAEEVIDNLIFIHGFDIPVERIEVFNALLNRYREIGAAFGKRVFPIATNLRRSQFKLVNWSELGFGPVLAGAGLQLGHHHRKLLISASLPFDELRPLP